MGIPSSIAVLGVFDYLVFCLVLVTPLLIGLYYAVTSNKTTEDFLMAGRSMSPIPVAMSMVATFISSIAILGYVGEVYGQGITLAWGAVGTAIGMIFSIKVFNPMFYSMHLSSINEYIELRFKSQFLRRLVLLQSIVSTMLYLGICLFAPTLALQTVTPLSSETLIVLLGSIVTMYSTFGGLKAVVWTDAFQASIMALSIVIAFIASLVQVGGFAEVWRIGTEHGRTDAFDFRLDIYKRHTMLNLIMMNIVDFTFIYSFGQTTIQRLETMPDFRRVKQVMYMSLVSLISLMILLYFTGLCIFAVYAGCDPISLGYIDRKDQIFSFYVMDRLSYVKGIPGLFIACLFSGTMSSISSMLNAIPTMIWNDLLCKQPYFMKASENIKTITNKLITLMLGLMMIALAFMSSRMGGLIQATSSMLGAVSGPTFGIFLLGTCVPICSKKGAIAGLFAAMILMTWLGIGARLHGMKVPLLPLSTEECPLDVFNATSSYAIRRNTTTSTSVSLTSIPEAIDVINTNQQVHPFFGISYTFLSPIGAFTCIVVAVLVSLITGLEKVEEIDPALVLPCFKNYVGLKRPAEGHEFEPFLGDTDDNDDVADGR